MALLEIIVEVPFPNGEGLEDDPDALAERVVTNAMSYQNEVTVIAAKWMKP